MDFVITIQKFFLSAPTLKPRHGEMERGGGSGALAALLGVDTRSLAPSDTLTAGGEKATAWGGIPEEMLG